MPDIHILRPHSLGLPEARKVALLWAQKAEKKFDMECVYEEGTLQDHLRFSRAGVQGTLQVCAEQFALQAKLGFLFGVFQERIESEINAQLDKLLNASAETAAAPAPAPEPEPAEAVAKPTHGKAARKKIPD